MIRTSEAEVAMQALEADRVEQMQRRFDEVIARALDQAHRMPWRRAYQLIVALEKEIAEWQRDDTTIEQDRQLRFACRLLASAAAHLFQAFDRP